MTKSLQRLNLETKFYYEEKKDLSKMDEHERTSYR